MAENELKIFPCVTTTSNSDWQGKIKEIKALKIKEAAVFLTGLNKGKRRVLYRLLEKSGLKKIPLVHIRSDMGPKELNYLAKKFGASVFNTHTPRRYPFRCDYGKFRQRIFIENACLPLLKKELNDFAGICLDFSHLENDKRLDRKRYLNDRKMIKKFPIGCIHISAIKEELMVHKGGEKGYDWHWFDHLSEFNYLKKYPRKWFLPVMALELENPIGEQLRARDYILKLLT